MSTEEIPQLAHPAREKNSRLRWLRIQPQSRCKLVNAEIVDSSADKTVVTENVASASFGDTCQGTHRNLRIRQCVDDFYEK